MKYVVTYKNKTPGARTWEEHVQAKDARAAGRKARKIAYANPAIDSTAAIVMEIRPHREEAARDVS